MSISDLFALKSEVTEYLEGRGYHWLHDFTAIDIMEEEGGIEILGIPNMSVLDRIEHLLKNKYRHKTFITDERRNTTRDKGFLIRMI